MVKKKGRKGKGKKKGKKGAKKGKKKEVIEKKNMFDIPPYVDPEISTPIIKLKIMLVTPMTEPLSFEMEVPITTRIEYIKRKIIEKHHGAISNLTICLENFSKENAVDHSKTLEELNHRAESEVNLYYDYEPISYPLLIT